MSGQTALPLNGRRRSVLIGINYIGTRNELHGCINDVERMRPIIEKLGFPSDANSQRVLVDDGSTPEKPTLENMRAAIAWLVEGASAGDALFLHYSGHGGRVQRDGEYHETLCPLDMEEAGMLDDTELFQKMVRPLPSGCRLTVVLDSCHSAGALNLPFLFTGTQEALKKALAGEAKEMVMSKNWKADLAAWQEGNHTALLKDVGTMGLGLWKLYGKYKSADGADSAGFREDEASNVGAAVGEVIAFTGCASEQTSADVGDVGQQFHLQPTMKSGAGGALTTAFAEAMSGDGADSYTFLQLLEHIRKRLSEEGFSQVPQLASSLVVDLDQTFRLDTIMLPAKQGQGATGDASSVPAHHKTAVDEWLANPAVAKLLQAAEGGAGAGGQGAKNIDGEDETARLLHAVGLDGDGRPSLVGRFCGLVCGSLTRRE